MDFEFLRTQTAHSFIHRIQTDTATTDIGGLFTAAESWAHEKVIHLILAQTRGIDRVQDLTLDGGTHHLFAIDTGAVVAQFHMHAVALRRGLDLDFSTGRLAEFLAFLDLFDPVFERVVYQMQEGSW